MFARVLLVVFILLVLAIMYLALEHPELLGMVLSSKGWISW